MKLKQLAVKSVRKLFSLAKEKRIVSVPVLVSQDKLLDGKIALITGGSGGIGMGIAEAFLNSGARVIIAGTNHEKLKQCLRKLPNGALSH